MSLQDTPRSERLHIGLFGRRNSGKSSLVNLLTGQSTAVVSAVPGTTTDPVYKAMELFGLGPCVFIDTAGFDDEGGLGELRVAKTRQAAARTDIAIVVFSGEETESELAWVRWFRQAGTPVLPVLSKRDTLGEQAVAAQTIAAAVGCEPLVVSAQDPEDRERLRQALLALLPEDFSVGSLTGGLAKNGDTVLLVMPQDIQAPKGRLILPQVQTLRDLLDKHCLVLSATADLYTAALALLREPPALIVTDSQVFGQVWQHKPEASRLTSFSLLFARARGDLDYFAASVRALEALPPNAHILIAEACAHKPLQEDIGRVKLPRLLRQRFGGDITMDIVSGPDFPADLTGYALIIHCGACMFNRKYVLARVAEARRQRVPMTNYGIVLAWLSGIWEKIDLPRP